MSALDSGAEAIFPSNLLECGICYNIPSSKSMALCETGHVYCIDCRERLTKCGICQSSFKNRPIINILQKILTSVEIGCKFKGLGCNEKLNLEERVKHENHCKFRNTCKFADRGCNKNINCKDLEAHEGSCEFRQIFCFNVSCQKK